MTIRTASLTSLNQSEGKGFEFGAGDLAALTGPPKFKTVEAEREYLKIKLTAAMRIFDHLGYCHGVVRYLFCSFNIVTNNFVVCRLDISRTFEILFLTSIFELKEVTSI